MSILLSFFLSNDMFGYFYISSYLTLLYTVLSTHLSSLFLSPFPHVHCIAVSTFRLTLEKEAELETMRSRKRGERDFFKKMENGEINKPEHKPQLLVGRLKEVHSLF